MSSGGRIKQNAIEVTLQTGHFGEGKLFTNGSTEKVVYGLATRVSVSKEGLPSLNRATVQIYNIHRNDVATITTTSHMNLQMKKSKIIIKAGKIGEGMSVVFKGDVFLAHGLYPSPDTAVHIEARTGIIETVDPKPQDTHRDQVSGKQLVQKYAGQMGWKFNGDNVTDMKLTDPVLNGSPLEKARAVANAMDVQLIADDEQLILLDWDKPIPGFVMRCSKETGLIGSPTVQMYSVQFRHEYHSAFRQNGAVYLQSDVPRATGSWKITKLEHQLEAFGAGPAWDTTMTAVYHKG